MEEKITIQMNSGLIESLYELKSFANQEELKALIESATPHPDYNFEFDIISKLLIQIRENL
jgi:hypothetical protein